MIQRRARGVLAREGPQVIEKIPGTQMEVSIVMGLPKYEWFILENPTKMDDARGYSYFWKPPYMSISHLLTWMIYGYPHFRNPPVGRFNRPLAKTRHASNKLGSGLVLGKVAGKPKTPNILLL